jgi:hypothetical protein
MCNDKINNIYNMTINELINIVDDYIIKPVVIFNIDLDSFNKQDGRKQYNKRIREKVQNKFGIYIWTNSQTDEIIYIGMAGKIKTNNSLSNHSLQKRLLASRGRDKKTKKDIQTNDFVKKFMEENNIVSLNFYVAYTKDGIPPTYLETILLYEYFKEKKCLPKLNNSF